MSDTPDTKAYLQALLDTEPLRSPLLHEVIAALELPAGSRGLDAGCGFGRQALMLAEAIGPDGHVTGLDIEPEFIRYATREAEEAGYSERVSFSQGDAHSPPFAADTFDWVWSADCLGYPAGELRPVLRELSRIVKPGGTVALLAWSSQNLLPGYQLLEARLNAFSSSYVPPLTGPHPELHFPRALHWFREAGLTNASARTFLGQVQGPLTEEIRAGLASIFDQLWGKALAGEDKADRQEFERLCRPGSADFILDLPDYHAYFTYTLFRGTVAV